MKLETPFAIEPLYDLQIASRLIPYPPKPFNLSSLLKEEVGWVTGFEPATSGTTTRRSNQLSYTHHEGMYRIEKGEQILSEGLKARKHS